MMRGLWLFGPVCLLWSCAATNDESRSVSATPNPTPVPLDVRVTLVPPPGVLLEPSDVVVQIEVTGQGHSEVEVACALTTDDTMPRVQNASTTPQVVHVDRNMALRGLLTWQSPVDGVLHEQAFGGAYVLADAEMSDWHSDAPAIVAWFPERAPTEKTESYSPAHLLFLGDEGQGASLALPAQLASPAGLKVRGSSSATIPKRNYRLELREHTSDDDAPAAWSGLPADADFVLGGPLIFDRALMRNSLAYDVSTALGRYAPRIVRVELLVVEGQARLNSNHIVGVYEFTEHIERHPQRVAIERLTLQDNAEPDITGGYLFKLDRLGPGEQGFVAGDADGRFYFQQTFVWVDPDEHEVTPEQRAYLIGYLDEIGDALAAPDFRHPVTGRHYGELLDVGSFIDHHIVNLMTKNPDAFRLSGYYHKDRDGLLQAGPVWDFDRTMGCLDDERALDPRGFDRSNEADGTPLFDFGFYTGLFADPVFADQYWTRLTEVLGTALHPDRVDAQLAAWRDALGTDAVARNFARWPEFPPRESHAHEVELLALWWRARHEWLSQCVSMPDPRACQP